MKLKDKMLMITGANEGFCKSGSFKLKDKIEIERGGLLGQNEAYRPQDNLLDSRVLSNLNLVTDRH